MPLHSSGSWREEQEEAKGIWLSELRWARGSGAREGERERETEQERERGGVGWGIRGELSLEEVGRRRRKKNTEMFLHLLSEPEVKPQTVVALLSLTCCIQGPVISVSVS